MTARKGLILFDNLYHTICSALDSTTSSLSRARQAHAQIFKIGLSDQAYTLTKLVSFYANNSCFVDANIVLDSIPEPDILSFSTLIYASSKLNEFDYTLRAFSKLLSHGLSPDCHVFPSVIKACAGLAALRTGRQVHGIVSVYGSASDPYIQSSLLHMYIKCDQVNDADKIFEIMAKKDVVTWSALVAGYARHGFIEEAKDLFSKMEDSGVEPSTVSWNGMIAGFSHSGLFSDVVLTFKDMHSRGFQPNGASVSTVLPAVGNLEELDMGVQIQAYVIKRGFGSDKYVVTALIDMYGKCNCAPEMWEVFGEVYQPEIGACNAMVSGLSRNGLPEDALRIFGEAKGKGLELNVVSWTSMIACCSQNGKDMEALELLREMQIAGVKPNSRTIACLLPACGNVAALMHGKAVHCFSLRMGMSNDIYVGSSLIDMYANCGNIRMSQVCFDEMPERNLACWNALMNGYAMHGKAAEAIKIFNLMTSSGQKPDFISFTCVLSACSQGGLSEEGWHFFNNMHHEHGIEPRLAHYACVISLLGRVGKLTEAYSLVEKMPFKPDACVWGALLSSCRVHGNVSLGEAAAKELFELEPTNPGNYILLSNIYASKAMWKEVNSVRDIMKSLGVRKNPGCSWIEVKNKVHMLLAGDSSHSYMAQLIEKLNKLSLEMKESGFSPSTDYVLQDVEEQDKEGILCGHSEKLAVAFGLLNTSQGTTLRVIKNLRICGDCHAFIKLVSSFERREILVRDTIRFHHFKGGGCSCGDFW